MNIAKNLYAISQDLMRKIADKTDCPKLIAIGTTRYYDFASYEPQSREVLINLLLLTMRYVNHYHYHSLLKATMGSNLAALRAGINPNNIPNNEELKQARLVNTIEILIVIILTNSEKIRFIP